MKTFTHLFLALACVAATALAQALEAPYSELLPGRQYSITVTRSVAGNDGFRELLPRTTTQSIRIETGAYTDGSLPVTLSVFPTSSADSPARTQATGRPDWEIAFKLNTNLDVRDIEGHASEGEASADVLRAILMRQLGPILFRTRIAIERKLAYSVEVLTSAPAPDQPRTTAISYKLKYEPRETPQEPTAIVSSTGSARFNTEEQFYVDRRLEERSEMYVGDTGVGTEQRVIRMDETTVYQVTVTRN